MKLLVCTAESDDLEAIIGQGPVHAALGAFLDTGTCGSVVDVATDSGAYPELLERLAARCAGAGPEQALAVAADLGAVPDAAQVVAVRRPVDLAAGSADLATLQTHCARGARVSLVITDRAATLAPVWLLSSFDLPCLGPVAPCGSEQLIATWLMAAELEKQGDDILNRGVQASGAGERDLAARLKQLYGADY